MNYQVALDNPLFLSGYNLVMDVFDSNETRTYEEMQQIADLLATHRKFGRKCAILVHPDHAVRYGLARMLSSLGEIKGIIFSVFHSLDDAERVLDIHPGQGG